MTPSSSSSFLSPTEQAFLNGSREFTKAQQRYIRCRLKRKLVRCGIPTNTDNTTVAAFEHKSCNAAAATSRLLGFDHALIAHLAERGSPIIVKMRMRIKALDGI